MNKKIAEQIDVVIEAAMECQAETGPDPDYRRAAAKYLAEQRAKLITLITLINEATP